METLSRKQIRLLWRQAGLIEQQYRHPPLVVARDDATNLTGELIRIQRKLRIASEKQWLVVAASLQRQYQFELARVQKVLAEWSQQGLANEGLVIQGMPSQRLRGFSGAAEQVDIFRDLQALQTEFPGFQFERVGKLLSVTTESVELEGIWLGPFQISLEIDSLSRRDHGHYEVIAIEPYPASSNEDIVHPHVQASVLCEGDAQSAIRTALKQGRLLDFFQLVNSVLQNYNSSSPYVSLDDWGDLTCDDCGQLVDGDDCDVCSACEDRVCDQCWCCCVGCDERHCSACNVPCSECHDDVCKSCINPCLGCSESFCSGCLNENERCKSCERENDEDESSNHDDKSKAKDNRIPAHATVHSDSLD